MTNKVKISDRIRKVHPLSPLAGKIVPVTTSEWTGNGILAKLLPGERTDLVPVRHKTTTYLAEPEFIVEYQEAHPA